MNKTLWIALVVVAIIAITGAFLGFKSQLRTLGANSGNESFADCRSDNGVTTCHYRTALRTATTTPCAFKTPSATSTLVYANLQINTATSTATTWTLARATSAYATTTVVNTWALSSAARGTLLFTATSTSVADDLGVFAPDTYAVWGVSGIGTSMSSSLLLGTCEAVFIQS